MYSGLLLVASDDEDDDSDAVGRRLKDENVCLCINLCEQYVENFKRTFKCMLYIFSLWSELSVNNNNKIVLRCLPVFELLMCNF